jgi:hypothetical protein
VSAALVVLGLGLAGACAALVVYVVKYSRTTVELGAAQRGIEAREVELADLQTGLHRADRALRATEGVLTRAEEIIRDEGDHAAGRYLRDWMRERAARTRSGAALPLPAPAPTPDGHSGR